MRTRMWGVVEAGGENPPTTRLCGDSTHTQSKEHNTLLENERC